MSYNNLFTNKKLSLQLHDSGVSALMIEAGIEVVGCYYNYPETNIWKLALILKKDGIYGHALNIVDYAEKKVNVDLEKDVIPAWCAEQLWDYLITLFPITYKNKYLHLDIENQKKSSLNSICFFPTVIDEDDREMFSYGGKLTDPSVPANMLLKLQEMGMLK